MRTHNLSRRAAVDLRLRPRGHWDWQQETLADIIIRRNTKKFKQLFWEAVNYSTIYALR